MKRLVTIFTLLGILTGTVFCQSSGWQPFGKACDQSGNPVPTVNNTSFQVHRNPVHKTVSDRNILNVIPKFELRKVEQSDEPAAGNAIITLRADNIWEEYFGYKQYYQMLLDADADALGENKPWNPQFSFPAIGSKEEAFEMAEYKIPENADPNYDTTNGCCGSSASVEVPAGTYDLIILLADSQGQKYWYCYNGYFDDFVIEAGAKYEFYVYFNGSGDNCEVNADVQNDVSITKLVFPISGGNLTAAETVTVTLNNSGKKEIPSHAVKLHLSVDNREITQETVDFGLAVGESRDYTFAAQADLSAYGDHEVETNIEWNDDELQSNNYISRTIRNLSPISSLPYKEDFSSAASLDSWLIESYSNEPTTWTHSSDIGPNGDSGILDCLMPANGDRDDWLISPPVVLKEGKAHIVFWYKSESSRYPSRFEVYFGDKMSAEFLEHQTSVTAQTNEWSLCPVNVTVPADGVYYFAIRNTTQKDMGYLWIDDITIDNFVFTGKPDLALNYLELPIAGCGMEEEIIKVNLSNLGTEPIKKYALTYISDEGNPIRQEFADLAINGNATVCFNTLADFSALGQHTVKVTAEVLDPAIEENISNNEISGQTTHFEPASLPYTSDMAAGEWNPSPVKSWNLNDTGMQMIDKNGFLISRCISFHPGQYRFILSMQTIWVAPTSLEVRMGLSGTDPNNWTIIENYEQPFESAPFDISHSFNFNISESGSYCFAIKAHNNNPLTITQVFIEAISVHDLALLSISGDFPRMIPVSQTGGKIRLSATIGNKGAETETEAKLQIWHEQNMLCESEDMTLLATEEQTIELPFTLPKLQEGETQLTVKAVLPCSDGKPENNELVRPLIITSSTFGYENEATVRLESEEGLVSPVANSLGYCFTVMNEDLLTGITLGLAERSDMEIGLAVWRIESNGESQLLYEKVVNRGTGGKYTTFPINPIRLTPGTYFIEAQQLGADPIQIGIDYEENGFFLWPSMLEGKIVHFNSVEDYGYAAIRAEMGEAEMVHKDICVRSITLSKKEGVFSANEPILVALGNYGCDDLRDLQIVCTVDGKEYVKNISEIPANSTIETTLEIDLSQAGMREINVTAVLENDNDPSDNSKSTIVESWPPADPYVMNFEYCEDFAIESFEPGWTTVNRDNSRSYPLPDVQNYPNMDASFAFMAFNPSMTDPILWLEDEPEVNWQIAPFDGNRFGAAFPCAAGECDDWIISPKLKIGKGAKFSFQVKSLTEGHGQAEYLAWISTESNDPDTFTKLCERSTAPFDGWEEVSFDLSAYEGQEVYVAVQHVSNMALLMIDCLKVTSPSVNIEDNPLDICLNLYPNPATDHITITSGDLLIEHIEIYNIMGMLIYQSEPCLNTNYFRYNTSALASGNYVVRVTTSEGRKQLKFFVH